MIEDVRLHGVRERIVIYEGAILDGRNRYNAALAVGLLSPDDEPNDRPALFQKFVVEVDGNALDYVVSKNIHRRHLTTGQRAYAMAEYEVFRHGGARRGGENDANLRLELASPTRSELAETGKVSERSIASAAVVRDSGVGELKVAVKQGAIAVSAAEQIARLPEAQQPAELAKHLPNGARSIMGSRQEPADSLDYFPTPPWATRALFAHVLPSIGITSAQSAWEPACGGGHMAAVMRECIKEVFASDIHNYGSEHQNVVLDFLTETPPRMADPFDWIITNPPFDDKAVAFVLRAIAIARIGVAMFFRWQWLESIGRYEALFKPHPPAVVAPFVERVNLCKGRWEPKGTTATAYCWIVWIPRGTQEGTRMFWIPPGCRTALTYPYDAERFGAASEEAA